LPASQSANAPPYGAALLAELIPIVGEINAALDPDELHAALGPLLRRLLDYRGLALYRAAGEGALELAYAEPAGGAPARMAPGEGLAGAAAASPAPLVLAEPAERRDGQGLAELALALRQGQRLVGVLQLSASPSALGGEVQAALSALAMPLAVALSNATQHREARWYAGLLATLYEIGKETASILDLDELLTRVGEIVKRVIDYEMFGILLVEEGTGDLVLRKSVSYGGIPEKTRLKPGEGLCGAAVLSKRPVLVGDVSADARYLNLIPHARSELVVPLLHKDRVVGVFDLESSDLHRFTEEHLKVLTPLASQVAVAIENARLVDELVEQKQRLGREMAIARRVQHGLFPEDCPDGPGWEAAAEFSPARELGGDLYDFYDFEEGVLGLAVGDVEGKGVPAALYGAFASGTVRARAFERLAPAGLLFRVNRTLRRRGVEGLFCTLFYCVFDFPAGRARMANSGLPYPLHYRSETGKSAPIELAGVPLGAFDGSTYDELEVDLRPGDVFVFFSDGVVEASREGEEYGAERLAAVLEKNAGGRAPAIAEAVVEDLYRYLGDEEPSDDLTVVVVKVRP